MTHFEIALIFGCLSSLASVLTAWHFHTKIGNTEKSLAGIVANYHTSLVAEFSHLLNIVDSHAGALHTRLDKDVAGFCYRLDKDAEKIFTNLKASTNFVTGHISDTTQQLLDHTTSEAAKFKSSAEMLSLEAHSKIDTFSADTLSAIEKALEVFHLHSASLENHAAALKVHAMNYQDRLALSVPKDRSVPTR